MEPRIIIGITALILALAFMGMFAYYFLVPRRRGNLDSLMGASRGGAGLGTPGQERERLKNDPSGKEFDRLKKATRKASKKKEKATLDEKYFYAGMFSPEEKQHFQRMRILIPLIATPGAAFMIASVNPEFAIIGAIFGFLVGLQAPMSMLDRRIKHQGDEIMYYLPLVIEQVAIGVSSSLDIGPCLARIVSMADERDSHNAVTELIRHAQFHVKSGVSLEEALTEVGKRSGHTELKHAFMSLAQVAKHGGEITRQLQELADSVSSQRETQIEAKIKKLELEATAPVALVFAGFLVILLIGFGVQIKDAFKK